MFQARFSSFHMPFPSFQTKLSKYTSPYQTVLTRVSEFPPLPHGEADIDTLQAMTHLAGHRPRESHVTEG